MESLIIPNLGLTGIEKIQFEVKIIVQEHINNSLHINNSYYFLSFFLFFLVLTDSPSFRMSRVASWSHSFSSLTSTLVNLSL